MRTDEGEGSGGLGDGARGLPVPRQEFIDAVSRMTGDALEDVGEPGLRVDFVHSAGDDQAVHGRGPLATAVRPAEEPRFSAKGNTSEGAFGGIVREADASVPQEQGEGTPALEDVADRLVEV